MSNTYQQQTISILKDAINDLDGRGDKYKKALLPLIAETIEAQRTFNQRISGTITPRLRDAIDAHCKICPEPDE
tara:strand:- start:50 stop:271 length:222 start_codon:yes stop_codon:yes gene_type:complete